MKSVAFMRELVAKGMSWEDAAAIAERFDEEVEQRVAQALEVLAPKRTPAAERQATYRRRKREAEDNADHNAEHNDVTNTVVDSVDNAPLSLPPSPQTPQPPTHTRVSINSREDAREDAAFGRFWADYPRKISKADARKAFAKAWRKLPDGDEDRILTGGLERAKASWVDAQFIPHAATWLNGERWNDEPPPPQQLRPAHERPHAYQAQPTARTDRLGRSLAGLMAAVDEREDQLVRRRTGSGG